MTCKHSNQIVPAMTSPNVPRVWCADCKNWFRPDESKQLFAAVEAKLRTYYQHHEAMLKARDEYRDALADLGEALGVDELEYAPDDFPATLDGIRVDYNL